MSPGRRANFERLLKPRQIAFIGGRDALIAIGEARRRGYDGAYWPVNPKRTELGGIPCFRTLDDLPEGPDAIFLAIPAAQVPDAVRRLSEMGAGGVVCYSAGFKEAGPEGATLEAELRDALGDMVLIGPNCYGLINYIDNVALWPFAHGGGCAGSGAAIATQSGMFSSDITMAQRSLPLAYMVSAGNQADIGLEDFVDIFHARPEVRAIGLHIEGLQDVPRFERIALAALERGTPIVALKTGSSAIGSALAVSHTGSLAGAGALYHALFERTGIISVSSPAQLLETLKFLCVAGAPRGRQIAGFTCSGGGAAMLADYAETIGVSFPSFDETQTATLSQLLPEIATVSNPLDYTTPIWGQPEYTGPVFAKAMAREEVDAAVLVQDYPATGLDESQVFYRNDAAAFGAAAAARAIPATVCATLPENLDDETREWLISQGVAPMQGLHETLNAIRDAASWHEARQRILTAPPESLVAWQPTLEAELIDEFEGKRWLEACGMPVPKGRCVGSVEVGDAAREIGFPVALKMMSPRLLHKTEAGAVTLGIRDEQALGHAIETMNSSVQAFDPDAVRDRFLVEKMSPEPLAELLVAIRRDPQFGLALTLGSGGVLVELIGDVVTLLLPTHRPEVKRALERLKVKNLLSGFRGRPLVDIDALAKQLTDFADRAVERSDEIVEIEINPLFVYVDHCIAVDALVLRHQNTTPSQDDANPADA